MLSLNDDRWTSLGHAYGECHDTVEWLRHLHDPTADFHSSVKSFDYWSALCHQQSVYTATYATIPHLVNLVTPLAPNNPDRGDLLCFVGYSVACAHLPGADDIPDFLRAEYESAQNDAVPLLSASIPFTKETENTASELRHMMSALAACRGYPELAFMLADMDCSIECPNCDGLIEPFESNLNLLAGQ
ncbi:hypothetical protein RSSM_03600 [Rhodopirellula sallentina SM41]|uniref:Uncharacterized protein n=2 Tax=Rhodopirellula TaxID=265488 RepID=M5UAT9_9BACT|nr:hypothetical protein RSSM_03600 [Rhodopirellula sallentina SM41]